MTDLRATNASSRGPRLAGIGVAASMCAELFIVAVNVVFLLHGRIAQTAFSLIPTLLILNLTLVGGLLAIKRPNNVIGWILLGAGILAAVAFAAGYYADLDDLVGRGQLPFTPFVAWVGAWAFVPAIGFTVALLPMVFPSGRLPGPLWRIPVAVVVLAVSLGTLATATAPGPLQDADWIANPVRVPEPLLDQIQAIGVVSNLLALPIFLVAIGGLVLRFRRSRGTERQQLKWFLFVATFAAIALGISIPFTGPIPDAAWVVGLVAIACLPLAFAVAILRYRLYEIDRIVSRTVSYAVVTVILIAVFVAFDLVLEAALADLTQADTVAVAASTLVVFALFQPLRRRVQALVDRRFDRNRYEAGRIAEAFAEQLRDEVDVDQVRLELDAVLTRTVAPARAALWIRSAER